MSVCVCVAVRTRPGVVFTSTPVFVSFFWFSGDGETCSLSAMCCEAFANMLKESELSLRMLQNAPVSGVTSATF